MADPLSWIYPAKSPPKEGYVRHQYFLVLDRTSYDSYTYIEKSALLSISMDGYAEYAEIFETTDQKFIGFRAWVDLPNSQ